MPTSDDPFLSIEGEVELMLFPRFRSRSFSRRAMPGKGINLASWYLESIGLGRWFFELVGEEAFEGEGAG